MENKNEALKEQVILSMIRFPFFSFYDIAEDCHLESEIVKTYIHDMQNSRQILLRKVRENNHQLLCIRDDKVSAV